MNIFRKIKASLRLWDAMRKAEDAHRATGERFFVMPMDNEKRRLIILSRSTFRKYKQKRYIPRTVHTLDLERECFYCTGNGSEKRLSEKVLRLKREQYFKWYK